MYGFFPQGGTGQYGYDVERQALNVYRMELLGAEVRDFLRENAKVTDESA